MCTNPVLIPNKNLGNHLYKGIRGRVTPGSVASFKDLSTHYLKIGCGHCSECIHTKQMGYVQRVQMESKCNHLFFSTLTYNNESLRHLVTSTGVSIPYADYKDMTNMCKRIREGNLFTRPFRYCYVSELGGTRGRPHFHVIWMLPKYKDDTFLTPFQLESHIYRVVFNEWRRNYGSRRSPVYKSLFTYHERWRAGVLHKNFDTHYIQSTLDSDESSVAFYILKYMLKPSDKATRLQQALHLNLPEDEYDDVWKIVKPRFVYSKGFGLNASYRARKGLSTPDSRIVSYLREGIARSKEFPKYYNPLDGKSFPLSRYYSRRMDIFDMYQRTRFYFANPTDTVDTPQTLIEDDRDLAALKDARRIHEKRINEVADSGIMDNETFDED